MFKLAEQNYSLVAFVISSMATMTVLDIMKKRYTFSLCRSFLFYLLITYLLLKKCLFEEKAA